MGSISGRRAHHGNSTVEPGCCRNGDARSARGGYVDLATRMRDAVSKQVSVLVSRRSETGETEEYEE